MLSRLHGLAALVLLGGCSSLLPRSEELTRSPWPSYREAQLAFDKIVPGATTVDELRALALDPGAHPNIAILSYSDILRRFMPNQTFSLKDLDHGVRECITAGTLCMGYEVNQRHVKRRRNGNFFADVFGFRREVHIEGWRFNGLILMKKGVVIYKLTGGQPQIREHEESENPLGPLQGIASKIFSSF